MIRKRRRRLWLSGHPCARARRRRGRPRSSSKASRSGQAADVVRDGGQGEYESVRRLVHGWAPTKQLSGCAVDRRATDIRLLVRRPSDVVPEQLGESRAQATRRSTTGLPDVEGQPGSSIGDLRVPVERRDTRRSPNGLPGEESRPRASTSAFGRTSSVRQMPTVRSSGRRSRDLVPASAWRRFSEGCRGLTPEREPQRAASSPKIEVRGARASVPPSGSGEAGDAVDDRARSDGRESSGSRPTGLGEGSRARISGSGRCGSTPCDDAAGRCSSESAGSPSRCGRRAASV